MTAGKVTPSEVKVTERSDQILKRYAKEHHISRSEALRIVLAEVARGNTTTPQSKKVRVLFRDPGGILTMVARRSRRSNVPIVDLVDAAIPEVLG